MKKLVGFSSKLISTKDFSTYDLLNPNYWVGEFSYAPSTLAEFPPTFALSFLGTTGFVAAYVLLTF